MDNSFSAFNALSSGTSFRRTLPKANNPPKTQTQRETKKLSANLDFFASSSAGSRLRAGASGAESSAAASKKRKASTFKAELTEVSTIDAKIKPAVPSRAKKGQAATEEIAAFRRRLGIRVRGDGCPDPIYSFEEMPFRDDPTGNRLKSSIISSIESSEWKEPTAVQMQAIPAICQGRDIVASAPTGSGKTAAFVLPAMVLMAKQAAATAGPRVLLLAPTRELAAQIYREATVLAARGTGFAVQLLTKARVANAQGEGNLGRGGKSSSSAFSGILVSTPMRLLAALRQGCLKLSSVELVVLDEADRLFELGSDKGAASSEKEDNGFLAQIDEILGACDHPRVQRALFSATMGDQVAELVATVLRDPVHVSVGLPNAGANTIEQRLTFVGKEEGKLLAFRQLIQAGLKPPVLVFLQSKERAKELYNELVFDGINVDIVHADRSAEQRDAVIRNFRLGKVWVLLCTDLLARGVDFKGVNMVVNYDFPPSSVAYIHRIGRTGRAGKTGLAVTFFTEADMPALRSIANVVRLSGGQVPDWMLALKQERRDVKKRRETGPPVKRDTINTAVGAGFNSGRKHSKKTAGGKKGPNQSKKN